MAARPAEAQSFAYVTNKNSNNVSVINTSNDIVVATVAVSTEPVAIAITPDGVFGYAANSGAGTVSVISTATNTVVAGVSVGSQPGGVAITPDGAFAYVANFGSGNVSSTMRTWEPMRTNSR